MGQFKSYQSLNLERQVKQLEDELIAYKSTQLYGANQIRPRLSYSAPINSVVDTFGVHSNQGKIRFVGVNKNKLARGSVAQSVVLDNPAMSNHFGVTYTVRQSTTQSPNVLEWNVLARCAFIRDPFGSSSSNLPYTCPYVVTFIVNANMAGVVTYETL